MIHYIPTTYSRNRLWPKPATHTQRRAQVAGDARPLDPSCTRRLDRQRTLPRLLARSQATHMSRCLAAALLSTALAYPHRWLEQTDDVGGCGVLVSNRQGDSGMMGNGYRYVFPTTTSFINAVGTLGDELQPAEGQAASWKASVHSDAYMQKRLCAQQRRCPPLAAAHREAEIEWTATACLSRPSRAGPGEQQQGLVRHSRGGRAHPFERQQQWLSTLYELASWRRRGLRRPPPAPLLPRVSYLCPACGVQATLLRLAPLNRRLSGRCRPRRTGNTPSKAPGRSGE